MKFLERLAGYAKICRHELSAEAFGLYDELIAKRHGDEQASAALLNWIENRRGFPAPGELLELIRGPAKTTRQQATDLAALMLAQISRRGRTWVGLFRYDGWETFEDAVRNELGDDAWQVIDRVGGWANFCQQFDEGTNGNARAQLRDICEVQIISGMRQQARNSLEAGRTPKAISHGEERQAVEHQPELDESKLPF